MADLEITVRYNSPPAKLALTLVVLALPFWGIMIPAFVVWIGFMLMSNNSLMVDIFHQRPMQLIGFLLGLLLVTGLGVKAVLNLSDNRIILSKNGLELPFFLGSTLGLRRNFSWVAISSAQLVDSEKKREIVIHTTDGFPMYLDVKCFAPEELEQFLVALNVWAINCKKTPELELLQDELQQKSDQKLLPSYTAMWDEELSRRFTATAYVPLEPEQVLQGGRLKVVSQLSFGGLSAVYLCQYKERELVVLKESVVPQDSDEELKQKATELFEREARLLMKIDHPSIVKVLDCFVEATRQYLLIEYRSGQDLSQFIKQNGAQREDKVLKWAADIVEILEYLHSQDPPIIHRDVTPDNLVLDGDGELVMIDFGAANEFLGNATGTLVGKQSFIAPEQFRGHATAQSDLYALGCTLSFLLTAQEPVPLSVSHPQKIDANISDDMDKLVADLTSMNLEDRIVSANHAKIRIEEIRTKCLQTN
ncbi:MAG: serine/threonine protein kinase [Cyanobacteria bacterium SZAS-4]|nr:serine/threonine protein kinase [Cyanobacteria bacterium SZAS-4]